MNTPQSNRSSVGILQSAVNFVWPYVGGKRGLIILTVMIMTAGLILNWGWLVAAGVAPILISVLPCVVMCGVGVCCLNKGSGKSCSSQEDDHEEGQK